MTGSDASASASAAGALPTREGGEPARERLLGDSDAMCEVRERIRRCARFAVPVLVTGETGTGKELVARAIHAAGDRGRAPFVAVNCAAITGTLFESELFGAQRGAYTGAVHDRDGLVAAAGDGTLFLDEIGELSLDAQAKLLRLLDDRSFRPVGESVERAARARVIAATNRDLAAEVERGNFRRDLLYRLDVANIQLPPLRERLLDLPVLVDHFLLRARDRFGQRHASARALEALRLHRWPGNVRELEHVVTRTLLWCDDERIESFDVRSAGETASLHRTATAASLDWDRAARLLQAHRGRLGPAAAELGVSLRTLQRRLRALGMNARDFRSTRGGV